MASERDPFGQLLLLRLLQLQQVYGASVVHSWLPLTVQSSTARGLHLLHVRSCIDLNELACFRAPFHLLSGQRKQEEGREESCDARPFSATASRSSGAERQQPRRPVKFKARSQCDLHPPKETWPICGRGARLNKEKRVARHDIFTTIGKTTSEVKRMVLFFP
ncbi:hypothetical protein NDU88_003026 [Pleurodeles waltl]|uniref:Uncharacterized protein n=1 Tax=Pleurodeles waltl TaxID=8319 RepID=A0AAV7RBP9_PLEWA|nr:hypothetical protein NDU88_003026 [Pleurodeles waltl]